MYSMVMMMAVAGSGDVASFGGRNKGCDGGGCSGAVVVSAGCDGGSCHGERKKLFGGHKSKSCDGGSCSGVVVAAPACCAAPAPAPVVIAPVCCAAPAPESTGCCGGGRKLFGGGLFGKHKNKGTGCCGGVPAPTCCDAPAPVVYSSPAPCSLGTTTVMPPAATAPAAMPTPAKEMPKPADAPKKAN